MDSLSIQFIKLVDDILENCSFEYKKLVFKNVKNNSNDIYYYSRDILKCLGLTEKNDIYRVLSKVDDKNKFTISELYNLYSMRGLKQTSGLSQELISKLKQYELKYTYVNKSGLYELILFSESLESKPFKDYIFKTLLISLDNNYHNILLKQKTNVNDTISINNQIFSDINKIKSIEYNLLNNS